MLIILWYDNFGENHTPLQRNGMTAIPKIWEKVGSEEVKCNAGKRTRKFLFNFVEVST